MTCPEIVLLQGDITCINVDAIVNAANERMLGGGGVDGAIHRAAGPYLKTACERVPEITPNVRCPTGEARITPAYNLASKVVIHTVGPVYDHQTGNSSHRSLPSHPDPASALASAYRNSLTLAAKYLHETVAFPAISCGVYGYPPGEAAKIGYGVVREQEWGSIKKVIFVLFEQDVMNAFQDALDGKTVSAPAFSAPAFSAPTAPATPATVRLGSPSAFDDILAELQGGD